ncbi:MAG: hypothetical protein JXR94_01650 [Candidatus Hydrogenedentes bacterium]|nr:hypothetical protein [Candidatus Hydrogenedentota bacterium]
MKRAIVIATVALLFVLAVAGGAVLGVWFERNYRILPVSQAADPARELASTPPPADAPAADGAARHAARAAPREATPAPSPAPAQSAVAPRQPEGPFAFRFTPGEHLSYQLGARVVGTGAEMQTTSGISLNIAGVLGLATESVGPAGDATMRLTFDSMDMSGTFMGTPVRLTQNRDDTYLVQGDKTDINTALGLGSIQGIPQLEFFRQPIQMEVAQNGQVRRLWGSDDIASMLAVVPAVSTLEFPSEQMAQGQQWESQIALPVPGFGTAADARLLNTLLGYQYVGDRLCAVIQQDFLAEQQNGTLDSPESALGEAMQFSMPLFELTGRNMIYFDVNAGQLVHTDMDLYLALKIGDVLGQSLQMLTTLTEQLLSGDDSGLDALLSGQAPEGDSLDLGVAIQGSLALLAPSS